VADLGRGLAFEGVAQALPQIAHAAAKVSAAGEYSIVCSKAGMASQLGPR